MNSKMKDNSIAPTILFCTFLVLKLTHVIDWSWWWVFAPFWAPIALIPFFYIYAIWKIKKRNGNRQ